MMHRMSRTGNMIMFPQNIWIIESAYRNFNQQQSDKLISNLSVFRGLDSKIYVSSEVQIPLLKISSISIEERIFSVD